MDRVAGGHINRDLGQENCVRFGDNNFNLRETKVSSNQNASSLPGIGESLFWH